jgi:hypothetical protein
MSVSNHQLLADTIRKLEGDREDLAAFLEFIKREGLPFYRLGARRIMFDTLEVDSWLAHRKVGGLQYD